MRVTRAPDSPRPTTIVEAPRLAAHLGLDVFLATETFQRTGSFKFRAAFNVAANVPHPHVITASSGNFGQAMAYACKLFGKRSGVSDAGGAGRATSPVGSLGPVGGFAPLGSKGPLATV